MKIRIESISKIDSPYYFYLVNYPPNDIVFLNRIQSKVILGTKFVKKLSLKKLLINFSRILHPLKIKKVPTFENIDLYHSARTLLVTKKPYVIDFEHYGVLGVLFESTYLRLHKHIIRKFFRKKNLRYILPWTKAAYNTIPKEIRGDSSIKKKIRIVYPAIPVNIHRKRYDRISLLFIARYFYSKGGATVLRVFRELNKKYDNLDFVIVTNKIFYEKYSRKYKFIKWYYDISKEKLSEIYKNSHIYVYPGYSDTFGFTILEALANGLPIITTEGFAREELVIDGKTGYIIKRSRNEISDYIEKISYLVENVENLKKMSKNAWKEVEKGKFSIEKRNSILKEIYESSLKY